MATTRFGVDGSFARTPGDFSGKTLAPGQSTHPVGRLTAFSCAGSFARTYGSFAGKRPAGTTPVTPPPRTRVIPVPGIPWLVRRYAELLREGLKPERPRRPVHVRAETGMSLAARAGFRWSYDRPRTIPPAPDDAPSGSGLPRLGDLTFPDFSPARRSRRRKVANARRTPGPVVVDYSEAAAVAALILLGDD